MRPLDGMTEQEWQTLIEQLRQSGLRLDRQGRWWHEGQPVGHQGLARALHRWLDRLADGRFVVRLDATRFAYVAIEDAPFFVRTVTFEGDPPAIRLLLSDETVEDLAADSLAVGQDNALYCRVKGGRFEARFSRQANQLVSHLIDEDDEGFLFGYQGQRIPLRPRGGPSEG
jgi:hypothetical protein